VADAKESLEFIFNAAFRVLYNSRLVLLDLLSTARDSILPSVFIAPSPAKPSQVALLIVLTLLASIQDKLVSATLPVHLL
jgi:hypothetical protein